MTVGTLPSAGQRLRATCLFGGGKPRIQGPDPIHGVVSNATDGTIKAHRALMDPVRILQDFQISLHSFPIYQSRR